MHGIDKGFARLGHGGTVTSPKPAALKLVLAWPKTGLIWVGVTGRFAGNIGPNKFKVLSQLGLKFS